MEFSPDRAIEENSLESVNRYNGVILEQGYSLYLMAITADWKRKWKYIHGAMMTEGTVCP